MGLLRNSSSGALPQLAPDLTWPSDKVGATQNIKSITGINAVGALTTALSLTGKFYINYLNFNGLTAETITIKLTIDGVVLWNDTYTSSASELLFGTLNNGVAVAESIRCNTSFLLEIQTLTDANVTLDYLARPIL